MRMHLKFVAPILIAGALVLTSCGSSDSNAAAPTTTTADRAATSTEQSADTFNDADVAFLQGMYPHHAQAVEMTDMVPGRTTNPDVLALAVQIEAAQQPEIDQMTAMLKGWGAPVSAGDHAMPMEGMVSEGDLKALSGMQGPAFDAAWVKAMIGHHEGAVSMAEDVLTTTQDPAVKKLAQAIITGQRKEIAEMQAMPTT